MTHDEQNNSSDAGTKVPMTHDELLAKINADIDYYDYPHPELNALRTVVEILKGYDDGQVRVNEEFNQGVLSLSNVIKEAIEKELG